MADETPQEMIEEAIRQPASASIDGKSATSHSLPDMIAVDKYLAGKTAAEAEKTGLRFFKLTGSQFE